MMRKPWGALCAAILLVGLVVQAGWSAPDTQTEAAPPARLLAVEALGGSGSAALQVRASGPFTFTSYQPSQRSLIVDLAGVVSNPGTADSNAVVDWAASYRLLPFRNASGRRVLRMDLTLARDCNVEAIQPQSDTLVLACGTNSASASVVERTPAPVAAPMTPTPAAKPVTATPAVAVSPAPAEGPVEVRAIDVHPQGTGVVLDVVASGPLGYETTTLQNPTRLVIDLPAAVLVKGKQQIPIDQDDVVGVRIAQFKANPPVTRVVVDLLAMVPFDVDTTAEGLRVRLGNLAPTAEVETPVPAATEEMATLSESAAPETNEEESAPVLLASLAPTLPSSMAAVDAPTPIVAKTIEAPVEMAALAPAVEPMPAPVAAPMTPAPAPVAAPASVEPKVPTLQMQPFGPQEGGKRYTGEPISVNLKDVDLKDFFRLIHEISGLNIIVDPGVGGNVTMVLIDVPWDQALDIVLKNNSLGASLEGNVLRIASLNTLKKEQQEARELAKARSEAVEPVTVTRTLSYATGRDLETTLKRFLSSRGEIIRDDRTNTLIIRDIPQVIPEVDNLIQQLDRKTLQVEIEARVVSASRTFAREIGSQFATSFSTTGGRNIFGGALGPSPLSTGSGLPPPPLVSTGGSGQPLVSDLRAAATSGFLFGHRSPNFALDAILTAAENRNIAKVLSKPRLVTQNNITAEVKQGTRIPVQTVVNNTISTQFIDVVLRLNVTPQITADGNVFLNIIIENTRIDPGIARINGIPALATQSTTTQVLIADGGTVVVGGVMTTDNATTVDQVPLLGSVPIIGYLFKRTRVSTTTSELLFFITPRILPG